MDAPRANGFVVLRLPVLNRDPEARGAFTATAPCVAGRCYGGVDRMPWFDVDEAFYDGTLPPGLRARWEALRARNADPTGLTLTQDVAEARELLGFSNRAGAANELVAVHSASLDEIKGTVAAPRGIEWIGWDVVALGWWSLLGARFAAPDAFPGWEERITAEGLLASPADAEALALAYDQAEARHEVEPIPDRRWGIAVLRLGRMPAGAAG